MTRYTILIIAALFTLSTMFAVTGCKGTPPDEASRSTDKTTDEIGTPADTDIADAASLPVGEDAVELALTTTDGKAISLGANKGKITVVYFWATYCKPCIEKLPKMQAIYEAYNSKGVEIWALAQDPDQAIVDAWLETHDISFPVAMADQSVNDKFFPDQKLLAIPQAVIIGTDGKIAARLGTDLTLEDVENTIKQLLGEEQ